MRLTAVTSTPTSTVTEFEAEARSHARTLFAVALRLTRDPHDAEDLVQDALVRGLAAWDRFAKGTNCRAWLVRILTNRFISGYRRNATARRYVCHEEAACAVREQLAAADDGDAVAVTAYPLCDQVVAALGDLPPDFRRVVTLCDVQGLSYREAARRIGCPVGTVMSRLHRARRALERSLEPLARERGILRRVA